MRYSREAVEKVYTFTHRSGRKIEVTAKHMEEAAEKYYRLMCNDPYLCVTLPRRVNY